jgi:hypothetical protein
MASGQSSSVALDRCSGALVPDQHSCEQIISWLRAATESNLRGLQSRHQNYSSIAFQPYQFPRDRMILHFPAAEVGLRVLVPKLAPTSLTVIASELSQYRLSDLSDKLAASFNFRLKL